MTLTDVSQLSFHCRHEDNCAGDCYNCSNYVITYKEVKEQLEQLNVCDVKDIIDQLREWSVNTNVDMGDGSMKNMDIIASENAIAIVRTGGKI